MNFSIQTAWPYLNAVKALLHAWIIFEVLTFFGISTWTFCASPYLCHSDPWALMKAFEVDQVLSWRVLNLKHLNILISDAFKISACLDCFIVIVDGNIDEGCWRHSALLCVARNSDGVYILCYASQITWSQASRRADNLKQLRRCQNIYLKKIVG